MAVIVSKMRIALTSPAVDGTSGCSSRIWLQKTAVAKNTSPGFDAFALNFVPLRLAIAAPCANHARRRRVCLSMTASQHFHRPGVVPFPPPPVA
jgi:hypothetical protein